MKLVKILFVVMLFIVGACNEKPISDLSPEQGMDRVRKKHADGHWEEVITQVNEYRSRYPYTPFSAEAELLQADAFFQGDRFPEAIAAYEEFIKKNPKHAQANFASFRVAQSYDKQSPKEIDREQENAYTAIDKYNVFLERYPDSKHANDAKTRVNILKRRVADHFVFVARFYWKKKLYSGALNRYLQILEKHSNFSDLKKEATERAASAYNELADILEKDPESEKIVYFRKSSPADLRALAKELKN